MEGGQIEAEFAAETSGRRTTDFQLHVATQQYVQSAPRYLLGGVFLGIMGFLIAVIPYLLRVIQLWNSGKLTRDDVPATVSELVSRWDTVEARVFFGFELVAALLILMSEYPFKLKNACCVPSAGGCSLGLPGVWRHLCFWATFRHFMPPLGLALVALCPTVKIEGKVNAADAVLITVHLTAALQLFAGFLLAEAHSLSICVPGTNWAPFRCRALELRTQSERNLRLATWWVAFICWAIFSLETVALAVVETKKRRWNVISFMLEVIAGISILVNHGVIWYYCHERKWGVDLARRLETEATFHIQQMAELRTSRMSTCTVCSTGDSGAARGSTREEPA